MAIIVVKKTKRFIVGLGGKTEWIFGWGGGCKKTERCVDVMNDVSLGINEVGDVLVAVVEVIREETRRRKEDEWAGGDGFGGIPGVGVIEGVVCALELLDTEIVIVDEALKRFYAIFHCAHFDTAAHAVEGHGDHGVAGLPADGAVFGIVGDRPNAGLGLDEGLISIRIVLGREVINGDVLVEVVGGVGLAFGGGTVSDVIVGIGSVIRGDQLIADIVPVLLLIFRSAAAEEIICVDIRTNLCTIGVSIRDFSQ